MIEGEICNALLQFCKSAKGAQTLQTNPTVAAGLLLSLSGDFPLGFEASQIPDMPSASGEVAAAVGRGKGILGSGGGGKRVTPKCGKLGTWTEFGGGFKGERARDLSFPSVFLSRPPDDNACASSWMLSGNYKNNPLVVSSALPIQPFQTMRDEDIFLPWPSPSFTGLG